MHNERERDRERERDPIYYSHATENLCHVHVKTDVTLLAMAARVAARAASFGVSGTLAAG